MNKVRKFFGIALVAAIAISMAACPDGDGGENGGDTKTPTITIKSAGNVTSLVKGNTLQFTAELKDVTGTVVWSITTSGTHADTKITAGSPSTTASLAVNADETLNSLTIKAAIGTVSDTFNLTLDTPPGLPGSITISSGGVTSLAKGNTLQFTATPTNITGTPTWSIVETTTNSTISSGGLLMVNAAETLDSLTIQAAIGEVSNTFNLALTAAPTMTVTSSGNITSLDKGATLQFATSVTGTITWSIVQTTTNSTIDTTGLLKVNAAETLSSLTIKAETASGLTGTFNLTLTVFDPSVVFGVWDWVKGSTAHGKTFMKIAQDKIEMDDWDFSRFKTAWEPFTGSGALWGGATGYTKGYRVIGMEDDEPASILIFWKAPGSDGKARIGVRIKAWEEEWLSTVINDDAYTYYQGDNGQNDSWRWLTEYVYSGPWTP